MSDEIKMVAAGQSRLYGTYEGRRRVSRPKFDFTEEYFAGLLPNVETDCVRKKKGKDIRGCLRLWI